MTIIKTSLDRLKSKPSDQPGILLSPEEAKILCSTHPCFIYQAVQVDFDEFMAKYTEQAQAPNKKAKKEKPLTNALANAVVNPNVIGLIVQNLINNDLS